MRDPDRILDVLATIEEIWTEYPELRLCQLIANVCDNAREFYYMEDDELKRRLLEMYNLC